MFSCSKIEQKQLNTWVSFQSAEPLLGQFSVSGNMQSVPMVSALAINSGSLLLAACRNGLGIMQVSVPASQRLIDSGELVEVLPEFRPPPIQASLLLPHRRHVAPRVEAVLNWLTQVTRPYMQERAS